MHNYTVYTDGSYQSSLNAGGYSCVILENNKVIKTLYQGFKNTSNNRMEIRGVLECLKYIKEPSNILIISDSQYVINSITQGWVEKWFVNKEYDRKNLDLWFELLEYLDKHTVTFKWVKGHNNDTYNELADMLCVHAAQCLNLPEDIITHEYQKN